MCAVVLEQYEAAMFTHSRRGECSGEVTDAKATLPVYDICRREVPLAHLLFVVQCLRAELLLSRI